MERDRAHCSVAHPPLFNGEYYSAWKHKMRAFLLALDSKAWKMTTDGWNPPTTINPFGERELKEEDVWTVEEQILANSNRKALNALFVAVNPEQFAYIENCETSREAWDILRLTHEGDEKVKEAKLDMVSAEFESLKMQDSETIQEFYAKFSALANSSHNLGEKIPEIKLIKKFLRSLPNRFDAKRTAFSEMRDLTTVKRHQVIGSFRTYEMEMNMNLSKKAKNIALKSVKEEESSSSLDNLVTEDEMALFTRQLRKFLKLRNSGGNQNNFQLNSGFDKNKNAAHSDFREKKPGGSVKCYECGGIGHIAHECANTLKKQSQLSDSEDDSMNDSYDDDSIVAFVGKLSTKSDEESDNDVELIDSEDELIQKYEELVQASYNIKKQSVHLSSKVVMLQQENTDLSNLVSQLKQENEKLKFDLDLSRKREIDFTIGAEKIDNMMKMGKSFGDKYGLGFTPETVKINEKVKFVKAVDSVETVDQSETYMAQSVSVMDQSGVSKYQSKQIQNLPSVKNSRTKGNASGSGMSKKNVFIPVCHFCNKKGHIRPNCFKLKGKNVSLSLEKQVQNLLSEVAIISNMLRPNQATKMPTEKVWVRKTNQTCLIALNALSVKNSNAWYFDSGCSNHMTGDKSLFLNYSPISNLGSVTFGDGSKSSILGRGTIFAPGINMLENVFYVENLKPNLISISQLCDQDTCNVSFSKGRCVVSNKEGNVVLTGLRSSDNCYCVETNLFSNDLANIENLSKRENHVSVVTQLPSSKTNEPITSEVVHTFVEPILAPW
ncbi:uncharacterized protein LOC110767990, partial [Prunus avium]|uniref:Uncharacterized protein LOC110767990 n=1 Tax=Prunus avium TaxID=42229 RepID=A0A6P5TIY9_PRUAV